MLDPLIYILLGIILPTVVNTAGGKGYGYKGISKPASCTPEYEALGNSIMCEFGKSLCPNEDNKILPEDQQAIVDEHNRYRGSVEPPATNMEKMYWDDHLAALAQKWADTCPEGSDNDADRKVPGYDVGIGQNFARGDLSWETVLESWHSASSLYQYGDPFIIIQEEKISQYTMMVHAQASRIGCGFAECCGKKTFVCNYAQGQPPDLSPPYENGTSCSQCPTSQCSDNLCDCGGLLCFYGGTLDVNTCTCSWPDEVWAGGSSFMEPEGDPLVEWRRRKRAADQNSSPIIRVRRRRQALPPSCTSEYKALANSTMCFFTDDPNADACTLTDTDRSGIVNAHNGFRRNVSPSANNMQKMYWDEKIAVIAQKYANTCPSGHDTNQNRQVPGYGVTIGQNLAYGHSSWTAAITAWHSEVQLFNYGGNFPDGGWKLIGHYTQVVLHKASRIGCGCAECNGRMIYACNYAFGQSNNDLKTPYGNGLPCASCLNSCSNKLCDCNGKICFNGGTLNINTCTCSCNNLYTGETCSTLQCPDSDPTVCGTTWPSSYCAKYSNVPIRCPYMCGKCGNSTDVVNCPGKDNEFCLNGGTLNKETCTCECTPQWTGETCSQTGNSTDAVNCPGKDNGFCLNGGTLNKETCTCECTPQWTGETCSQTVPCPGKDASYCKNGGAFYPWTCKCRCRYPWTGIACTDCPLFDRPPCNTTWKVSHCNSSTTIKNRCPIMCGTCKERCPGKGYGYCQNAGILDGTNCTCKCRAPWTGDTCGKLVRCPLGDAVLCGNSSTYTEKRCGLHYVKSICPYMCKICKPCAGRNDSYCGQGTLNKTTCTCACPQGWKGDRCQERDGLIDVCAGMTVYSCLNGGRWNSSTCKCDCSSSWSGPTCNIRVSCPGKGLDYCANGGTLYVRTCRCRCRFPWRGVQCSVCPMFDTPPCNTTWTPSRCSMASVKQRCPIMCGTCPEKCPGKGYSYCNNNGLLDGNTCTCRCKRPWTGDTCNVLEKCPLSDAIVCGNIRYTYGQHQTRCGNAFTNIMCPYMCKFCEPCSGRDDSYCENGGTLNMTSCTCKCMADWTGERCQDLSLTGVTSDSDSFLKWLLLKLQTMLDEN